MAGPLLVTHNVSKHFGGFSALNDVSLEVGPGQRVGLIGPNGSGKTTLINIITGTLPPNAGKIIFNDRDISGLPAYRRARLGMARTFQIPKPFTSSTLLENLTITMKFSPDAEGRDRDQESMQILRLIGIESKAGMRPGELNQIELRKLVHARDRGRSPRYRNSPAGLHRSMPRPAADRNAPVHRHACRHGRTARSTAPST